MPEILEGTWEDLIQRKDLQGRRLRVIVLEDAARVNENPWLKSLHAWVDSHAPVGHVVDDSREGIYGGTVDDPR